jgi:glutathione S-transferase
MPMKFHTQRGIPNPDVVHMYAAETGCTGLIEDVAINVMKGENRSDAAYMKLNPTGEVPVLVLDDGSTLAESTTIAKYLDELQGGTDVCGKNPKDRAMTDMWIRRVEDKVLDGMMKAFASGPMFDFFKDRRPGYIHKTNVPGGLEAAKAGMKWLDGQLADGRQFLCGDRFSLADIRFHCLYNFFSTADKQQKAPAELGNLNKYLDRVKTRASAVAIVPKKSKM